jgi:hypothetical protein
VADLVCIATVERERLGPCEMCGGPPISRRHYGWVPINEAQRIAQHEYVGGPKRLCLQPEAHHAWEQPCEHDPQCIHPFDPGRPCERCGQNGYILDPNFNPRYGVSAGYIPCPDQCKMGYLPVKENVRGL